MPLSNIVTSMNQNPHQQNQMLPHANMIVSRHICFSPFNQNIILLNEDVLLCLVSIGKRHAGHATSTI